MEAATPPPDPAAQAGTEDAAPAAPPPPPPDATGATPPNPAEQPPATAPEPPADPPPAEAAAKSDEREYTVFTERKLDLKSAANRKTEMDMLQALAEISEGKLTILVQLGRTTSSDPRKAVVKLGQVRDIDDDVEVIAAGARNKYKDVKTATKRDVSIG